MTNADRIRSMSNEELAEFIFNVSNGATKISVCENECDKCANDDEMCCCLIEKWLESEVDE